MKISRFQNPDDSKYVAWSHGNARVVKRYSATVHGIALASGEGVVIVEPFDGSPNNAVIYNADGSERVRLENPMASKGAICFAYPYYVGSELTLVSAMHGLQFGCVFDENGQLQRVYETR